MGNPWIKMEYQLWDRPQILRIASACKVERPTIIGACFRLWTLADQFSDDGRLESYTPEIIDSTVGVPGFTESMASVGWVVVEPDGIVTHEFEKHHGPGAKRRALDAKRKREGKSSGNVPQKGGKQSACNAEAKRPAFVSAFDALSDFPQKEVDKLNATVVDWLKYKEERGKAYKETGLKNLLGRIRNVAELHGPHHVVDLLRKAMGNGWDGWEHGDKSANGKQDDPRGNLAIREQLLSELQ